MAIDSAILLPLLVAPGVVFMLTFRANRPGRRLPNLHLIALSLILSLPTHIVLLPWTRLIWDRVELEGPGVMAETATAVWLAYLVFAVPTSLAVIVSRASEWSWFQTALGLAGWTEVARTRFAWDRAFAPEDPAWVLITFHSGALLGGKYASGAFASLETEARDLYLLEPHAVLEDGSWTPTGAAAAWIPTQEIALMEFFRMEEE